MALRMDSERRRKMMALARLQDEWQAKCQIDDADCTPDGADGDNRRSPTPEQEWEFVRHAGDLWSGSGDWTIPGLSRARSGVTKAGGRKTTVDG
jgi:hypothetical protein